MEGTHLQIAIFDDQQTHAETAARAVEAYWTARGQVCQIMVCTTCEMVHAWLDSTPDAALIFLDIAIEGEQHTGIDLAHVVAARRPECQIVYLTSHLRYATEIFETDPLYFVLKDELTLRLPAIYDKFMARCGDQDLVLRFQRKGGETLVRTGDIMYCEHRERKIDVVTPEQKLTVYRKMDELAQMLVHSDFIRCHNSYIVNLRYVTEFRRAGFTLRNGELIPISRSYYPEVKERFAQYLAHRL